MYGLDFSSALTKFKKNYTKAPLTEDLTTDYQRLVSPNKTEIYARFNINQIPN